MEPFATYKRPAFLNDHPPVTQRLIVTSQATEVTLLAGAVLGHVAAAEGVTESVGPWTPDCDYVVGVLAGDVTIPTSGDMAATVYIHGSFVRDELIFADGTTAAQEQAAIRAMRSVGLFA